MAKVDLNTITSGFASTDALNTNFAIIEEGFDNTLSLDGSTPNSMSAEIDMNSSAIINLGAPQNATSAARLQDVTATGTINIGRTIVNSIANLRLADPTQDQSIQVTGYYSEGDGGGGEFYWDSASTEADDDGTIIKVTAVTTGRFKRLNVSELNILYFGAVLDGIIVTDAAITASDNTLTSASNLFTSDAIGKNVLVAGAGAAGTMLVTTIANYTSSGSVEVTTAASTTVSGEKAVWGTNDAVAIQAAIDLASTKERGDILFPPGICLNDGVEVLNDNINLIGFGIGATKVVYTNVTGTVATFSFGQSKTGTGTLIPVSNCSIRKMEIDCLATDINGVVGAGIRTTVFDGFTAEEIYTYDCWGNYGFGIVGTGLTPRNALKIKDCIAVRCGADGLDIKAGLHRVEIDGFYTKDHVDQTGGDSVGLDVRGQYISVRNVFAENCIEYGVRLRINTGVQQSGDPGDWTLTQDACVSMSNCFAYECRDGFSVASPLESSVSLSGCHALNNTRYGFGVGGDGITAMSGCSATKNLTGMNVGDVSNVKLTNMVINNNTQDGMVFSSTFDGTFIINGGSISDNVRYGINYNGNVATSSLKLLGCDISRNVTNFIGGATTDGAVEFVACDIKDAVSRGVQIDAASSTRHVFTGGEISGNAVDIFSENSDTTFTSVTGVVTKFIGQTLVPVDSTGTPSFSFTHGLYKTPITGRIFFTLARDSGIEDFDTNDLLVTGTSSTTVTGKVTIAAASATGGANVGVNCYVEI